MRIPSPFVSVRAMVRTRWQRWLARRLPATRAMVFDHRNLFVFPTETGFAFAFVALLVFLCGVNYANALILGFSFLLVAVGVVTIHLSFFALAGSRIEVIDATPGVVGEEAFLHVRVTASKRGAPALAVRLLDTHPVSVNPGEWLDLRLRLHVGQRGWNSPGRVLVESVWPFSLIRVWTWWQPDQRFLGFPCPESHSGHCNVSLSGEAQSSLSMTSSDDSPDDIRRWRSGDPLARIVWRTSIRTGHWHVRHAEAMTAGSSTIDVSTMPGPGLERRYSQAAYSLLEGLARGELTGVITPAGEMPPGTGPEHTEHCMRLLALSESS